MKKQILITTLLLMPAAWLHAQENKHAQAMRTAFVETIYGKFPNGANGAAWTVAGWCPRRKSTW